MPSLEKMEKTSAFLADWTNFYYAYGLLAGNGAYVFGDNGKNPKDIVLLTMVLSQVSNTLKLGTINGLKVCKTLKVLET